MTCGISQQNGGSIMGYYINPKRQSKEQFLSEKGERLTKPPKWENVPDGFLPVALVDNGPFTAAGICYSERELACFSDDRDPRPIIFYMVSVEDLIPVSDPGFDRYL